MAFGWVFAGSSGSGKSSAYAVKQKRRFKTTTNSAHRLPVADNLLGQQFKVSQPNAVWVSDITYIPTDEGWLYLVGHRRLCSPESSWAMPWESG